jgi:hypothetical protein
VYINIFIYYYRSEFDISQVFLHRDQVPDLDISLGSAARKAAVGSGQGFSCCAYKRDCTAKQ